MHERAYEIAHDRGYSLDQLRYQAAHGDRDAAKQLRLIARAANEPRPGLLYRLFGVNWKV